MTDADTRRAILRLVDELLPPLIARLGASNLGELEIRDGGWRVRLRRRVAPAVGDRDARGAGRRRRASSSGAGDEQFETRLATGRTSGNGARPQLTPVGPGREGADSPTPRRPDPPSGIAASPAVGYYAPREGLGPGHAVRAGDVVGHVDVLGVRQEVVSPIDGIVARLLAEPGEAVEFGQELVRVDVLGVGGDSQSVEAG